MPNVPPRDHRSDAPSFGARDSATVADRRGCGGRWMAAALAASVVLVGCSKGKSSATAPTTTAAIATTTVEPTTTTIDPKQQVIAAYQNYWVQYGRVTSDPNGRPDDPVLLATVAQAFAKQMELNIFGLRSLHRYSKGNVVVRPQQVEIQGSTASLLTCNRDDSDQFDENGKDLSVHQGVGVPKEAKASLVLSLSGGWLVDRNYLTGASCSF